jgi:isoamylase
VKFTLPSDEYAPAWDIIIDTAGAAGSDPVRARTKQTLAAKSLMVLRAHSTPDEEPDTAVAASLTALTQTATTETASITTPAVPEPRKTKKGPKTRAKPKS